MTDLLSIKFDNIHGERLIIKEGKTGKLTNIQLKQNIGTY